MPKKETTEPLDEIEVTDSLEVKEITYKYGIPIDDYDVDYGIVKRNQSLSTILQKHGLSVGEVHRLVEKSKDVFDVRKIRSDQAYAVLPPGTVYRRPVISCMKSIPNLMSFLICGEITG